MYISFHKIKRPIGPFYYIKLKILNYMYILDFDKGKISFTRFKNGKVI